MPGRYGIGVQLFSIAAFTLAFAGWLNETWQWIKLCNDCHEKGWSAERLKEMDAERKEAWKKLYEAEDILKSLRFDNLLYPSAKQRPP